MSALRFVEGGAAAADTVAALIAQAFDPRFGEGWSAAQLLAALALPGSHLELAVANADTLAGFTLTRRVLDEVELLLCAVAPVRRGTGLGLKMLRRIEERGQAARDRLIFLEVRDSNAPARKLYEAAGFAVVGRRRGYYLGQNGVRHDAITMRRVIAAAVAIY